MKILFFIFIFINILNANSLENINNIIKNNHISKNFDIEYNKYVFENPKELLKLFKNNKFYNEFDFYFEKFNKDDKAILVEYILDATKDYSEFIYNINLYDKLFIPSEKEDTQEFQYYIYNLLLDNKMAYYNIILYSNVNNHSLSIFNPNNLSNLNKRYKYFLAKFLNNDFIVSYPNIIDYLLCSEKTRKQLIDYDLLDKYDYSFNYYINVEDKVIMPFIIKTILYDKSNKDRFIEVLFQINFKVKLNDFILSLKDIELYNKISHDFIIKNLKDNLELNKKIYDNEIVVTQKDLFIDLNYKNYFNNIKLNLNEIEIINEKFLIRVKDKYNNKQYENINSFLKENSIEFIY